MVLDMVDDRTSSVFVPATGLSGEEPRENVARAAVERRERAESRAFFRGVIIALAIVVPFWVGVGTVIVVTVAR
ncbi:MAG: hypothetical protein K0S37_3554 [Microbacterium sp.]|jgi:hypothetical protein|nr:hypothetical protein [Microbacterium sp.]